MTKIKINNVELYAYHGVSLEEKNLGGKFSYDLEITFDISKASQTDNIEDTIDYAFMINLVSEFILVNKFNEFWRILDPTKDTKFNEAMAEYYTRVDYSFFNFRSLDQNDGTFTDRGKI